MRYNLSLCAAVVAVGLAAACGQHGAPVKARDPVPAAVLFPGLGGLHHPIATSNPLAQQFFDQGLTFVYAFNFLEAVHSFQRAAALDPRTPMPEWGIALARGPNFNGSHVSAARGRLAFNAIQRASLLAADAPPRERAYVNALAARFSGDPEADQDRLARNYAAAMQQLYQTYADDPDAATLYAESLMDLHAWRLWTPEGRPAEGTDEILAILDQVLQRWPTHIGANHFLIHALEASPYPKRALPSAQRLALLAPAAGHLVHMPAHLYMRTGDYTAAVRSTEAAEAADDKYLAARAITNGSYFSGYAEHNLQFLATAATMDGELDVARRAAQKLQTEADVSPAGQAFQSTIYFVLIRFARWREILSMPQPAAQLPATSVFWHYARGCALAGLGRADPAEAELVAMGAERAAFLPAGELPMLGPWRALGQLAFDCLSARIATARGDRSAAVTEWQAAVAVQDTMSYHEPPAWYPVRESLGAALLLDRQPAGAESAFREDLAVNPDNPRSLFGLSLALSEQGRAGAAERARQESLQGWKGDPGMLRIGAY
ncbi:MAG: hypothetical protein ACRD1L_02735 [Terriglobales bacterium]